MPEHKSEEARKWMEWEKRRQLTQKGRINKAVYGVLTSFLGRDKTITHRTMTLRECGR